MVGLKCTFSAKIKTGFLARLFSKKTRGIASTFWSSCKNCDFCNISVTTEDIYLNLEYVLAIQITIHTIKGDNSNPFLRIMLLFRLRLFILYQANHSRAFAPACGAYFFIG